MIVFAIRVGEENDSDSWRKPLWHRALTQGFLPFCVLLVAVLVAVWMLQTAPRARRRKQQRRASVLVNVQKAKISQERIMIDAMGNVIPAREVQIYPRVRGQVVAISKDLQPGGIFRRGRVMLRIDASDYRLLLQQRKSELARAKANLKIEMGRQWIAQREFKMLGKRVPQKNRDLMLRQPQLAMNEANVQIAKSAVAKARLDWSRTVLRAPFHSVVVSRDVSPGSQVTESTRLVRLVGTDEYWVSLSVPVNQLRWFRIPGASKDVGATVHIYNTEAWGPGVYRVGRVIRLNPALEKQGRMAQVLVAVKDPLLLKSKDAKPNLRAPRLLLGSYVKARIVGRKLPPLVAIHNQYVHNDKVWVMDNDNRLSIHKIKVLFRGPQRAFLSDGLQAGERIITTLLSTPVEGMPLRLTTDRRRRPRKKNGQKHASRGTGTK